MFCERLKWFGQILTPQGWKNWAHEVRENSYTSRNQGSKRRLPLISFHRFEVDLVVSLQRASVTGKDLRAEDSLRRTTCLSNCSCVLGRESVQQVRGADCLSCFHFPCGWGVLRKEQNWRALFFPVKMLPPPRLWETWGYGSSTHFLGAFLGGCSMKFSGKTCKSPFWEGKNASIVWTRATAVSFRPCVVRDPQVLVKEMSVCHFVQRITLDWLWCSYCRQTFERHGISRQLRERTMGGTD